MSTIIEEARTPAADTGSVPDPNPFLDPLRFERRVPECTAVIFGANLGGNLTPIGSASTLVAVTIIHRQGLHLSFMGFVKKAAPFALVQITIAVVYVLWIL